MFMNLTKVTLYLLAITRLFEVSYISCVSHTLTLCFRWQNILSLRLQLYSLGVGPNKTIPSAHLGGRKFTWDVIELQCSLVCRGRSHSRKREAVQDQKRFQSFPFQNSEQREPTGKDIKHNYYSYSRTFRTML